MPIQQFMQTYKRAWETSDEHLLASLFAPDGCYHNTPFAVQRGHEQIRQYWQRTKLQRDIVLSFDILDAAPTRGIAHWHTTYQVTSEEMFAMWASSSGTNALARQPGYGARMAADLTRANLESALDNVFRHPNVGPFLARRLIQRLVSSNPSPAYVGRVAAVFGNNGQGVRGDLAAVVRAILLDDEARSELNLTNPSWGKLREPMLRFIQWARSFKGASATGDWNVGNTSDPARSLGQSPQRSPSVFNYFRPGYVPAGTAIGTAGLVAPEFQLANESSVAGYLNFMQTAVGNGHRDIKAN